MSAGDLDMVIPADFIISILSSAPPFPPDIIAPACPILLPGGAVKPAINPTIGFFFFSLSSLSSRAGVEGRDDLCAVRTHAYE